MEKNQYNQRVRRASMLEVNNSVQGESIEQKIERITQNKEPITDGAPLIYSERKHGVLPAYNIKTDRFEIALDAMDRVHKDKIAQRESRAEMKVVKTEEKVDGIEPTNGTNE